MGVVNTTLVMKYRKVALCGVLMLTTGNQLKAARALVGMEQVVLADAAGVNVNTIRNMESKGAAVLTSSVEVVRRVQLALESAGVEFLNHGRPGVRLKGDGEG